MSETGQNDSKDQQTSKEQTKRPPTTERPDQSKATARISVYGLSVLCMSKDGKAADIGFVKDMHSPVIVEIFGPKCSEILKYECPQDQQVRIEVRKIESSNGVYFYQNGRADPDDFQWMPDLEEWHGRPVEIKEDAKDKFSAKLRLEDGVFYTRQRAVNPADRTDSNDAGNSLEINDMGRVLGSIIECEPSEKGIEIALIGADDSNFPKTLSPAAGPYEISFRTTTPHECDHLSMLYDIVTTRDGKKYKLKYRKKEPKWQVCPQSTKAVDKILTTEFACQTFGGGDGPLPELP